MRMHHLNCGTLRLPLGVAVVGTGGLFTPAPAVIHCLLAETDDGLLLVDTGFGTRDCIRPTPFMRLMMALGGSSRDVEETASRQQRDGWTSFQISDAWVLKDLRANREAWAGYRDPEKQSQALEAFHAYAYQWY